MAHVLAVAALEVRHPVSLLVLVKADDFALSHAAAIQCLRELRREGRTRVSRLRTRRAVGFARLTRAERCCRMNRMHSSQASQRARSGPGENSRQMSLLKTSIASDSLIAHRMGW